MDEFARADLEQEEPAGLSSSRGWFYLLLGLLCMGMLYVKAVGIDHQYFQLSNETSVESWSLHLPLRYRLEYWRYLPANPAGGLRLLQDEKR